MGSIIEILKQIFEAAKLLLPVILELIKMFKPAAKQAVEKVKAAREIK